MPKRMLQRFLPTHQSVRRFRFAHWFGDRLFAPELWHLSRRRVAGGVAAGMFCGLIPGPLQMLGAIVVALIFRVNVPVAVLCTLYTNPVTIIPLYLLAYRYGAWLTGTSLPGLLPPPPDWNWQSPYSSMNELSAWMLGLGPDLVLGLLALASTLALLGFGLTWLAWTGCVTWQWRRRCQRVRVEANGTNIRPKA